MQDQGPVIVIDRQGSGTRAAYIESGEVKSFYLSSGVIRIGDIYKARIGSDRMQGIGWFLKLGENQSGFLPKSELLSDNLPEPGRFCMVQIQKEPWGEKPAQVTEQIQVVGRGLIYLPVSGYIAVSHQIEGTARERLHRLAAGWCTGSEGTIVRTSAARMTESQLLDELNRGRKRWKEIQERAEKAEVPVRIFRQFSMVGSILNENHFPDGCTVYSNIPAAEEPFPLDVRFVYRPGEALFSHCRLNAPFKDALAARIPIRHGAYLIIDHTETLTSIDVNSGSAASGPDWERTALEINREAARVIARQIRLRGTGGMIVIDFIRMKKPEDRKTVLADLKTAVAEDPLSVHLFGFSPMGLVELTRKRRRPGLNGPDAGLPNDVSRD
jgi:Ribonucleases G and E